MALQSLRNWTIARYHSPDQQMRMNRHIHNVRAFVSQHALRRTRQGHALERLPPEIRVMIFEHYLQEHRDNLDNYYLDINYLEMDRQTWINGLPYLYEVTFKIKTTVKVLFMSLWVYLLSPLLAWLPSVAAAWLLTLPLLPFCLTDMIPSLPCCGPRFVYEALKPPLSNPKTPTRSIWHKSFALWAIGRYLLMAIPVAVYYTEFCRSKLVDADADKLYNLSIFHLNNTLRKDALRAARCLKLPTPSPAKRRGKVWVHRYRYQLANKYGYGENVAGILRKVWKVLVDPPEIRVRRR